jgi:hypothetical protein
MQGGMSTQPADNINPVDQSVSLLEAAKQADHPAICRAVQEILSEAVEVGFSSFVSHSSSML